MDSPGAEARGEVLALGVVSASLIFLQGVVEIASGAYVVAPLGAPLGGASASDGGASVLLSLVVGVLCWTYNDEPSRAGACGVGMIIATSMSLWVGGGFLVGFVLGAIGGTLAIVLPPAPIYVGPSIDEGTEAGRRGTGPFEASTGNAARPTFSEPSVVRYCPDCWAANDPRAAVCRDCGKVLPQAGSRSETGPGAGGTGGAPATSPPTG